MKFFWTFVLTLLRSLLLFLILFVGSWWFVTNEFPPRRQRVQEAVQTVQNLTEKSQQMLEVLKRREDRLSALEKRIEILEAQAATR